MIIRVKLEDNRIYEAWQWNGMDFPPETWSNFGFFEDHNGYDLEDCSDDFIVEPLRPRRGQLRLFEWVLRSDKGTYALCSDKWFKENCKRV